MANFLPFFSGKFGALQGERKSRFRVGYVVGYKRQKGEGWGVPSRVSPDGENNAAKKNMNRSKSAKRHGTGGP